MPGSPWEFPSRKGRYERDRMRRTGFDQSSRFHVVWRRYRAGNTQEEDCFPPDYVW